MCGAVVREDSREGEVTGSNSFARIMLEFQRKSGTCNSCRAHPCLLRHRPPLASAIAAPPAADVGRCCMCAAGTCRLPQPPPWARRASSTVKEEEAPRAAGDLVGEDGVRIRIPLIQHPSS